MVKKTNILLFLIIFVGIFVHFYNLNWGAPFSFHPDERNIASAVAQLQWPQQMNPHFFAYGSLPIYAIYFTGAIANALSQLMQLTQPTSIWTVSFEHAILISRIYSALFATLLIPLLFMLGKKVKNEMAGLLAAFFATASVGIIQFAHFGTFEMWLTFFGTLLFWSCLITLEKKKYIHTLMLALLFGVLISTKVSSLALLPLPFLCLVIQSFQYPRKNSHEEQKVEKHLIRSADLLSFLTFLRDATLFIFIATAIFIITNPYIFLDQKDFLSSMNYESSVALGTESVFYTGNFLDTKPGVYQLLHIFPFLINPVILILFIPAFLSLFYTIYKHKNKQSLLLVSFFLLLFLSQAVLFVKWTRYMMPTLPFIYLILAIVLATVITDETIPRYMRLPSSLSSLAMTITLVICAIFAFSYFETVYLSPDSRLSALTFATHTIPVDAPILAEPSDLGIMPFQDAFPHLDTFNFYDLDNHSLDATEANLQQKIITDQYIVLPSQRILQSRMQNPKRFPQGYLFYKTLLNGNLGYHQIYETPCNIFCKIAYLGDPIYWWEQTESVFDRPTVFIFKKSS